MSNNRKTTAYHEAGHALCAELCGGSVSLCSIEQGRAETVFSGLTRRDQGVALAAGAVGAGLSHTDPVKALDASNPYTLAISADREMFDRIDTGLTWHAAEKIAASILRANRPALDQLADLLLQKENIGPVDLHRVLKQQPSPAKPAARPGPAAIRPVVVKMFPTKGDLTPYYCYYGERYHA